MTAETMERVKQYEDLGLVVVDDFLPQEVAHELNDLWSAEDDWAQQNQVRENHFKHVFFTESPYFPAAEEPYMAKFGRSPKLEADARVKAIHEQHFQPALKETSQLDLQHHDVRAYRLLQGDYYRTHIDDYLGDIGCIYYLNKRWVWDWGGILHVGPDVNKEVLTAVFPKFNRAIFVDHGKFRFPHFISTVSEFAQNPRFTMITFSK